jgi:hypothetical protein
MFPCKCGLCNFWRAKWKCHQQPYYTRLLSFKPLSKRRGFHVCFCCCCFRQLHSLTIPRIFKEDNSMDLFNVSFSEFWSVFNNSTFLHEILWTYSHVDDNMCEVVEGFMKVGTKRNMWTYSPTHYFCGTNQQFDVFEIFSSTSLFGYITQNRTNITILSTIDIDFMKRPLCPIQPQLIYSNLCLHTSMAIWNKGV